MGTCKAKYGVDEHIPEELEPLLQVPIGSSGSTSTEELGNSLCFSAENTLETSAIGKFHSLQGSLCG